MCILGRDVLLYASSSLDGASRTPSISTSSVSDVGILSEEHFQFNFNLKGLKETMQLGMFGRYLWRLLEAQPSSEQNLSMKAKA